MVPVRRGGLNKRDRSLLLYNSMLCGKLRAVKKRQHGHTCHTFRAVQLQLPPPGLPRAPPPCAPVSTRPTVPWTNPPGWPWLHTAPARAHSKRRRRWTGCGTRGTLQATAA